MKQPNIVPAGVMGRDGEEAVPFAPPSEYMVGGEVPETDQEAEAGGPDENWTFWQQQITTALIQERRWRKEAQHVENLYFGPEEDTGSGTASSDTAEINRINEKVALIHANIEVMKPLVFSETPTPVVQRRWRGDGKSDETDLMAAECAQRLAQWFLTTTGFTQAMEKARDDWLIPGRGAARVLYRCDIESQPVIDPATGQPATDPITGQPVMQDVKCNEEVIPRAVEWRRLLLAPSHGWDQLPWLAFEVPMTRAKIEKRFPEFADRFAYNQKGLQGQSRGVSDQDREERFISQTIDRSGDPVQNPFDTATVWEIWNKETLSVIWWSPDCAGVILDKTPDPLNLEQFFPMARPLLATVRGGSMNPRPDVLYYEERSKEIDLATGKMKKILQTISVSGLFPGTMADQVQKLLDGTNQMVPVDSWIALMEKGGTANLIQWLPLEAMIAALNALNQLREIAKQAMYEASGISDIMRAQGDPRETAAAQNLKGRYAGMRLSVKQRDMAIYARDTLRLMVELGVEMFDTEYLAEICGLAIPLTEAERQQITQQHEAEEDAHNQQAAQHYAQEQQRNEMEAQGMGPQPPIQPMMPYPDQHIPATSWELVHARLKNDLTRKITINVETSSTVLADEQADKEARVEFLKAFTMFIQETMPLVASGQFPLKTVKEILMFGVRGFPAARTLEGMIAELPDEMPPSPPPEEPTVAAARVRAAGMIEVQRLTQQGAMALQQDANAHELAMSQLKGTVDTIHQAVAHAVDTAHKGADVAMHDATLQHQAEQADQARQAAAQQAAQQPQPQN